MTPRLYSVNVRADVMRQIKRDAPATHKFIGEPKPPCPPLIDPSTLSRALPKA